MEWEVEGGGHKKRGGVDTKNCIIIKNYLQATNNYLFTPFQTIYLELILTQNRLAKMNVFARREEEN